MSLYKYVTLERKDILLHGQIRYSQPGSFNDPFEMPAFLEKAMEVTTFEEYMKAEISKLASQAYNEAATSGTTKISEKEFSSIVSVQMAPLLKTLWERMNRTATPVIREGLKKMDKLVGILSLTETPSNLLMWSHYADQHRGMVIEFDENHPTFNERRSPNDEFRHLRKVVYASARPIVTLETYSFEDLILTKSQEWAYEKEWRILKATADAAKVISASPYDICLFDLPTSTIKRVIFGARVTDAEVNAITKELSSPNLAHVEYQRAVLDTYQFALKFNPI